MFGLSPVWAADGPLNDCARVRSRRMAQSGHLVSDKNVWRSLVFSVSRWIRKTSPCGIQYLNGMPQVRTVGVERFIDIGYCLRLVAEDQGRHTRVDASFLQGCSGIPSKVMEM